MKNFSSFAVMISLLLCTAFTSHAQTRTKNLPAIQQGQFTDFGGIYPGTASDSLQVTDSIAYVVQIVHNNIIWPYLNWSWTKSGSGTATVTMNFFQGNDPTNLFAVKAGVAGTTYSKTFTLSATGTNEVSFLRDTARFEGRYLKVQIFTSNTSSVKGFLVGRIKTSIQ